ERVESVVVDVALQYARERLLETLGDRGRVDRRARRGLGAEDLNRDLAVVEPHRGDALAEHLEAHVLEDLDRDIERDGLAARVRGELDPKRLVALTQLELETALAVRKPRDAVDVLGGTLCRDLVLIGGRVAVGEAIHERERLV